MHELIRSILIYVVIVTVLRGIITNENYKRYFKFVSGIIMILMMISPILNFIYDDGGWYQKLEHIMLKCDIDEVNDELKVSDGIFEKKVMSKCEDQIKKKVEDMAAANGLDVQDIDVQMTNKNDEIMLCDIGMKIGSSKNIKEDSGNDNKIDKIEAVQVENIMTEKSVKNEKRHDGGNLKLSKNEKKLKSDICDYFELEKDRVTLWH